MNDFPVGTVVWLKSGSPPMVVSSVINGPQPADQRMISVEWFRGTDPVRDAFDADSLQSMEPSYGRS